MVSTVVDIAAVAMAAIVESVAAEVSSGPAVVITVVEALASETLVATGTTVTVSVELLGCELSVVDGAALDAGVVSM